MSIRRDAGAIRRRSAGGILAELVTASRRVGAISIDQAVSSLTNLVASVIAAHELSPDQFGAFGIVFATYLVVMFVTRSMVGEVLLLAGGARARHEGTINLIIAAVLGAGVGLAILLAAVLIGGTVASGLAVLGIALAGLTLQDGIRYVGFATGKVKIALITDLLWLGFMLGAYFLISGMKSLSDVTAIWVFSGALAALFSLPFAGLRPISISQLTAWLRDERELMITLAADRGVVSVSQQGVTYIIALLIGLRGNAAYRAAQIVMGPINIVAAGLMTAIVPYLVRTWAERPAALIKEAGRIAIASAILILVLTQAAAHIPDTIGRLLIGHSWLLGKPVLEIMALIIFAQSINFAALSTLRVMGSTRTALIVRLLVVPLSLGAIALAAALGGIHAAMWTQAGSAALLSLLWWVVALRHHKSKIARQPAGEA